MSSAFESDASFPLLLAPAAAGSMCAIAVGVSSLRKRPRKPPLFFFSFSAADSGAAGCGGGGAHSSFGTDSCCGVGAPHGFAFGAGSFGFAVGAQAFAGASFEAGGADVQDSAGAFWAAAPCVGTPP